jgi:hypothetical protein
VLFALTIEGNLAAKPELRTTPDGTSVARMRVLRTGRRRDGQGNWVEWDVVRWRRGGRVPRRSGSHRCEDTTDVAPTPGLLRWIAGLPSVSGRGDGVRSDESTKRRRKWE